MTLRVRLTLWFTLLLALVLLAFAFLYHTVLSRTLFNHVDTALRSQAEQVVSIFEADFDPTKAQIPTAIVLAPQFFAQAATPDGRIIDTSDNLMDQTLPLPVHLLELNIQGEAEFFTWQDEASHLRIYSAPVQTPGGQVVATVQVGQSLEPIEDMLQLARLGLLIAGVIALILAAAGGYLISEAALRPLNEIAETASQIARTRDLEQRLEVTQPDDEVGRLAEAFNAMLERLQRLFRTQERLVADVSHELRTPLATIRGNLDLLRRGAAQDPEMLQEGLDAIGSETARMSRLIRDLLLLAEADAGVGLDLKPVELDTLLLEVYREALLIAHGRVKVRLGHEDQAMVDGDADRLKQLFLNLMSNAIKYTPDGGLVTLSLHCRPDGWVRVVISDTGIGIAEEDLSNIFDRFWRVDRARNRSAGGTGLGLSIARWIAEAHGGQLTVKSQLGKGSTFEVMLPRSD
ncbi:MAG: ATP-binding protein [Chloroflexota bacterium]|nr:ATP-binding protein [Chloroflexota bacterium]